MQVPKIQQNNLSNINFGAKLEVTGHTGDISSHRIKQWEDIAKEIGRDTDIIEIKFGKPLSYRYCTSFKKDPNLLKLLGLNPNKLFIVKRDISGFVKFADDAEKKYSEIFSYWSDFAKDLDKTNTIKYHILKTNNNVNNYLNKLKNMVRK